MDVEHLIDYLDTGLSMDTLRELVREYAAMVKEAIK